MNMDTNAIYVLWLRDVKRFVRAKSRVIGTLMFPLFFMVGFGLGFNNLVHIGNSSYLEYLVPGVIGMSLLFTAIASGTAVLWDRQFGFLKEILVTPNSRTAVVIGRVAGGATTAVLQSILVVAIAIPLGFTLSSNASLLIAVLFMLLIATTFISLGLIFGSVINDFQGFQLITSFFTFPLFFLSNAIFPMSGMPAIVQYLSYVNPLTYGVDGLRGALTGSASMPLVLDAAVLLVASAIMILIAAYAFEKTEVG